MFIKVNRYIDPYKIETRSEHNPVYVNVYNILYFKHFHRLDEPVFIDDHTQIFLKGDFLNCTETPEEIMKLIEEARMLNLASWSGSGISNLPHTITCTGGNFSK